MAWAKQNKGGSYLKFEEGKSIEGIYKGTAERPSPFTPGAILTDYTIEIEGEDKTLSSGSGILKTILPKLEVGTKVRIDMRIFKGRKIYDVFKEK